MAVAFGSLLNRKYNILEQEANARTTQANAQAQASRQNAATAALTGAAAAALDRTRARLMPAESQANIGLTGAQTRLTRENAAQVAPLAQSLIGLQGSSARLNDANVGLTEEQTNSERLMGRALIPGTIDTSRLSSGEGMFAPAFRAMENALRPITTEGLQSATGPLRRLRTQVAPPRPSLLDDERITEERGVRVFRGGR